MPMFEHGKWYPIHATSNGSDYPIAEEHDGVRESGPVILGRKEVVNGKVRITGPAIGTIIVFADGDVRASASSYHGFKWTHWSPMPDINDIPEA